MVYALTRSTLRAIGRYGELACLCAYRDHLRGDGGNTIGSGDARKGDAMINAGRDLVTGHRRPSLAGVESLRRAEEAFNGALHAHPSD